MKRREYIAKFLGDLAKIIFATAIITQIVEKEPNFFVIILGLIGFIGFFLLSLVIFPGE